MVFSAASRIIFVDVGKILSPTSIKFAKGEPVSCPTVGSVTPTLFITSKVSSASFAIAPLLKLTLPPSHLVPFHILLKTGPEIALIPPVKAMSPLC